MDITAVFIGAVGTVVALWGLSRGEFKALRGEMADLRTELRGEMGELRTEMRTDMRALGEKMDLVLTELLHHVQQGHPHGPPNQAA